MYPFQITGPNIILAHLKPTLKNATLLSRIVCENAAHLEPVFEIMVRSYVTPYETLASLEYDEACRQKGYMLPYYIFRGGSLIGQINAIWVSDKQHTEISYWLDKKRTGCGYMSEALALMEKTLFDNGHHQVNLCIDAMNWRSADVATRNGYKQGEDDNYYFKTTQMWHEQATKISKNSIYPICYFKRMNEHTK